jgi:uncharacterized damage-inducible protein DinB
MAGALVEHYRVFGRYNAWANALLYDAAATLPPDQYRADRGVFFKSLHGTLNHLLLTDRVWLHRFTGEGAAANRLDTILYDDFEELRAARRAEDARIVGYVDGLTDERIAGTVKFRRVTTPEEFEEPLAPMLAHWFNHQAHHRGQAHAVLTGLVGHAPELDLLFYQRQAAKAANRKQ